MQKLKELIKKVEVLEYRIEKLNLLKSKPVESIKEIRIAISDSSKTIDYTFDENTIHNFNQIIKFIDSEIDRYQNRLDPIKKKIDLITELLLEESNVS